MTDQPTAVPVAAISNGSATAAMVLGIVGAAFGLIPILGFLALILGVLAIVFGFGGRRKLRRGETLRGKGAATSGIVLGVVAIGLGIWGMAIVFGALDQLSEDLDNLSSSVQEGLRNA